MFGLRPPSPLHRQVLVPASDNCNVCRRHLLAINGRVFSGAQSSVRVVPRAPHLRALLRGEFTMRRRTDCSAAPRGRPAAAAHRSRDTDHVIRRRARPRSDYVGFARRGRSALSSCVRRLLERLVTELLMRETSDRVQ